ncbi:MAG: hypothetical protein QXS85_03580 [Acidilobaceae archaeon]
MRSTSYMKAKLALFLLFALLSLAHIVEAQVVSGKIYVMESGDVKAVYEIRVETPPVNIETTIIKNADSVIVRCDNEPVPYEYDEARGILRFLATTRLSVVEAYSARLTSKSGAVWTLVVNPHGFPVEVILPPGAVLVSVKPQDYRVLARGDNLVLVFPKGTEIEVEYVLAPVEKAEAPSLLPYIAIALALLVFGLLVALLVYRRKFRAKKG